MGSRDHLLSFCIFGVLRINLLRSNKVVSNWLLGDTESDETLSWHLMASNFVKTAARAIWPNTWSTGRRICLSRKTCMLSLFKSTQILTCELDFGTTIIGAHQGVARHNDV